MCSPISVPPLGTRAPIRCAVFTRTSSNEKIGQAFGSIMARRQAGVANVARHAESNFRSAGAKDWHSNLTIALDHSGVQHRLQLHHIFPKAVLSKAGVISREADDIANLAFIGGRTNRVISDKPPKEYLAFFAAKNGEEGFSVQ